MGSETREIVMAFSREFGETESPPRWDMKMERCLGRWLKGPLFLFELQSEVVMRNRLVLLAALVWCLSGGRMCSGSGDGYCAVSFERAGAG